MTKPGWPSTANGGPSKPVSFLHEMAEPNARLIAAAPELLEALELAEATLNRLAPDGARATQGTRDVIAAAIAKAKGETL